MIWLVPLFAIVALLYSSVGFGGGSTYTALLVVAGLNIKLVPVISLICNLIVTSAGVWKARKAELFQGSGVGWILLMSVPAAFLGGLTPISENALFLLLGGSLLLAGLQLGWTTFFVQPPDAEAARKIPTWVAPVIGAGVGYLSGIVGIGGGIFLAPVLHLVNWSSPRKIAALASAYIAANSVFGLAGKLISLGPTDDLATVSSFWPLIPAVILGSFIGHRFMLGIFPERIVKAVTAVLILIVSIRLLLRVI